MATNNNSNGTKGPGEGYMGPLGIALVVGYTLLFMAFVIYSLVSLWPPVRSKEVTRAAFERGYPDGNAFSRSNSYSHADAQATWSRG